MHCIEKEKNVLNLIDWLNSEASLLSRVRKNADYHDSSSDHQILQKSDNHAVNNETSNDVSTRLRSETPTCHVPKISAINR